MKVDGQKHLQLLIHKNERTMNQIIVGWLTVAGPFTLDHSILTWIFLVTDVPLILTSYPTGRFDEFLTRLNQYKNILVLVGAGISTAAGIPGMNKTKLNHVCSIHIIFIISFHFSIE